MPEDCVDSKRRPSAGHPTGRLSILRSQVAGTRGSLSAAAQNRRGGQAAPRAQAFIGKVGLNSVREVCGDFEASTR